MPSSVKGAPFDRESMAIGTFPDVRKTAGPSCLLCCVCLAVLDDSYGLKVIGTVERTGNGPVVRDCDFFPTLQGCRVVVIAELPFPEQTLAADSLRLDIQDRAKG